MVRRGIALVCLGLGLSACSPRVPSRPQPLVSAQPIVKPMPGGPTDGVRLPPGMQMVVAYGEDAWRLPESVRFGAAAGALIPAWDSRRIYVMEQATGQPVAAVWHGEARITTVTVDASGMRLAALVNDGSALYWPRLDAPPVHLVPQLLAATDDPVDFDDGGPSRIHRYGSASELGDHGDWMHARAAKRLSFSADGERLLAGMHLWELASRRDIFPLRPDEVMFDATHDDALIGRVAVVITEGRPGSQCGFVRTDRSLVLLGLDRRRIDGTLESLVAGSKHAPLPVESTLTGPLSAPGHAALGFDLISSIDVADDGRLVYVQQQVGWVVDGGVARQLRITDDPADRRSFDTVTLGAGAIYAVVHHYRPGRMSRAAYQFDLTGAAPREQVAGFVERIARDGRAVIGRDGGFEAWQLGARAGQKLGFRPSGLRSIDQGRAAGPRRAVLLDTTTGASLYVVYEPGRPARTIRLPGDLAWNWVVSSDGATVVAANTTRLRAFSLDDGKITLDERLTPATAVWAVAASPHIIAAGDLAGRVRIWRDGTLSEIDLGGRFDIATSLAISPDERHLAIGTGRGRIFVVLL